MSCPDLCTAAKCEELERKIESLERNLDLLKASFEAHVNQAIPEAHEFDIDRYYPIILKWINVEIEPVFKLIIDIEAELELHIHLEIPQAHYYQEPEPKIAIDGIFQNDYLYLTVANDSSHDTATILIPIPEIPEYEPQVNVDANIFDGTLAIDVSVGDVSDIATVDLPEYKPRVNVDANIFDGTLAIDVSVGDVSDIATVDLPEYEPRVNVDANIFDGTLAIDVSVGDVSDIATVDLPEYKPRVNVDANIFDGTLAIDVSVGDVSDIATVDLPEYEPDVTVSLATAENDLKVFVAVGSKNDSEIIALPLYKPQVNVEADIFESTLAINVSVNDASDVATVDLPREEHVKSDLKLDGIFQSETLTLTVADGESQDTATIPIPLPENTGGGGGIGSDNCSIDLIYENNLLTANLIVGQCSSSDNTKIMEFVPIVVEQITCSNGVAESKLVTVEVIKGTEAAELEAYSARASLLKAQCEFLPNEVVSIVASDKVIARASGKFLVLHFVTFNNYPKRQRNSTYWPVQIPAAKDEYAWENDFEPLRWNRGNCYAELRFLEFKNPVSGFFADKNAADEYFDAVLNLTTATEKNRVYSEHKTPQTAVVQRETRPYRAFIESVNSAGQAICHIKYVPPIEPKD